MGTKAVFAIDSQADGKRYWRKIVGCTVDGTPDNLRYLALKAKELGQGLDWTDAKAVDALLERLADLDPKWSFTDMIGSASWVSYSARYNPFTDTIRYYEDNFHGGDAYQLAEFPIGQKVSWTGAAVVQV